MTQPTKVEIAALNTDAKMWGKGDDSMAHTMSTAQSAAEGAYVPFPGVADELKRVYHQAQAKVSGLLSQGSDTFNGISHALSTAVKVYQGTDSKSASKVRKSWQPK